jgi:hypothetical protein
VVTAGAEAATAGAASGVVVSTGAVSVVAGFTEAVSVVAGFTEEASAGAVSAGEPFVVAVLVAVSVQCEADTCSAAAVSTGVAFVVSVLVAATSVAIFAITDFLMMSSSATSAFRGGGAIRTDITVTTRTITMDTATMGTAGTGTPVSPVMDTVMAADQGIFTVCEGGDKRLQDFLNLPIWSCA